MGSLSINTFCTGRLAQFYSDKKKADAFQGANFQLFKAKPSLLRPLSRDTVSFKSGYEVKKPYNHCAYCGEKVYTEKEINSRVATMLDMKNHKLEGEIKSVVEKLSSRRQNSELAKKKREVNKDEIDSLNSLMAYVMKNPHLSCKAILAKFFDIEGDEALNALKNNMYPTLRTIDHVSPQRLEQENNDTDMNLVESCYACNSKIKNGMTFHSFFALFPTIKDEMPSAKYDYALQDILANSDAENQSQTAVSTEDMLLHIAKTEGEISDTQNKLNSLFYSMKTIMGSVEVKIAQIQTEIDENDTKILEYQAQLEACKTDEEFAHMVQRTQLTSVIASLTDDTKGLSGRINTKNSAISNLEKKIDKGDENTKVSGRKKDKRPAMTDEERKSKLEDSRKERAEMVEQHQKLMAVLEDKKAELAKLDIEFPSVTSLRAAKTQFANVVNAFSSIAASRRQLIDLDEKYSQLQKEQSQLSEDIVQNKPKKLNPSSCSDEQRKEFAQYQELCKLLNFIKKNTVNGTQAMINQRQQVSVEAEMALLLENPLVKNAIAEQKTEELRTKMDAMNRNVDSVRTQKTSAERNIQEKTIQCGEYTLEQAQAEIDRLDATIKRLSEKEAWFYLDHRISQTTHENEELARCRDKLKEKLAIYGK